MWRHLSIIQSILNKMKRSHFVRAAGTCAGNGCKNNPVSWREKLNGTHTRCTFGQVQILVKKSIASNTQLPILLLPSASVFFSVLPFVRLASIRLSCLSLTSFASFFFILQNATNWLHSSQLTPTQVTPVTKVQRSLLFK